MTSEYHYDPEPEEKAWKGDAYTHSIFLLADDRAFVQREANRTGRTILHHFNHNQEQPCNANCKFINPQPTQPQETT